MESQRAASILLALFVLSLVLAPTLLSVVARFRGPVYPSRKLRANIHCDPTGRNCKCCSIGCNQACDKP